MLANLSMAPSRGLVPRRRPPPRAVPAKESSAAAERNEIDQIATHPGPKRPQTIRLRLRLVTMESMHEMHTFDTWYRMPERAPTRNYCSPRWQQYTMNLARSARRSCVLQRPMLLATPPRGAALWICPAGQELQEPYHDVHAMPQRWLHCFARAMGAATPLLATERRSSYDRRTRPLIRRRPIMATGAAGEAATAGLGLGRHGGIGSTAAGSYLGGLGMAIRAGSIQPA